MQKRRSGAFGPGIRVMLGLAPLVRGTGNGKRKGENMGTKKKVHITARGEDIFEGRTGACRSCGNFQDGCEPDARNYECENCGQLEVFGLEELLMMGELDIIEED